MENIEHNFTTLIHQLKERASQSDNYNQHLKNYLTRLGKLTTSYIQEVIEASADLRDKTNPIQSPHLILAVETLTDSIIAEMEKRNNIVQIFGEKIKKLKNIQRTNNNFRDATISYLTKRHKEIEKKTKNIFGCPLSTFRKISRMNISKMTGKEVEKRNEFLLNSKELQFELEDYTEESQEVIHKFLDRDEDSVTEISDIILKLSKIENPHEIYAQSKEKLFTLPTDPCYETLPFMFTWGGHKSVDDKLILNIPGIKFVDSVTKKWLDIYNSNADKVNNFRNSLKLKGNEYLFPREFYNAKSKINISAKMLKYMSYKVNNEKTETNVAKSRNSSDDEEYEEEINPIYFNCVT